SEVEEVVTELGGPHGRGESGAEYAVVEANGRIHVVRDECEVVDPTPRRFRGAFGGGVLGHGHDLLPFGAGGSAGGRGERRLALGAGLDCASAAACWSLARERRSVRC